MKELGRSLAMIITASISSFPNLGAQGIAANLQRKISSNSRVLVLIGRPTVVLSLDDVADNGTTELEVTVTPVPER